MRQKFHLTVVGYFSVNPLNRVPFIFNNTLMGKIVNFTRNVSLKVYQKSN